MGGIEHLLVGDVLADVGGHTAHAGHQTGFDAALDLIERCVVFDGVDEVLPLELIRIRFWLRVGPELFIAGHVPAGIGPAATRGVTRGTDNAQPLGAVHITG